MNVLLSIALSILSSFVFWLLTFFISYSKVKFSDSIARSCSVKNDGQFRYTIQFKNIGISDLFEVSIYCRTNCKIGQYSYFTYLQVGNNGFIPVLSGLKSKYLRNLSRGPHNLTIYPSSMTLGEYQKDYYPYIIREKARQGTLSVDDLIENMGSKFYITIYIFGNDSATGVRRKFSSKRYRAKDIVWQQTEKDIRQRKNAHFS